MSKPTFYRFIFIVISLTALNLLIAPVHSDNITGLDALTNYTAFCFGSFNGFSSQCQGSIAAANNVTVQQYTISSALPLDCERFDIIAGHNVTFNSGSVNGGISYGEIANITQAGYPCGAIHQPPPVNFTQLAIYLINTTDTLALYPPNGLAILEEQHLKVEGSDKSTNVFFISQVTAQTMTQMTIDVPEGSYAYINVGGQQTEISSLQMTLSPSTSPDQVLFNFPQSKFLQIGSVGFRGSILAPYASLNFSLGDMQGGFAAINFTGSADLQYLPFLAPDCICPPCSASIKLPEYTIYVLKNVTFTSGEDGGRLASGGNVTLTSYSVGNELNATTDGDYNLIVAQNLKYDQGSVRGSIMVGGEADLTSVSYSSLSYATPPIDFVQSFARLEANSQYVSQLAANGIVVKNFNEMKLEGYRPNLNIFYLTPDQIADVTNLIVIAPKQSWVVINIAGTNSTLTNMSMQIINIAQERILWNFFETANLKLEYINVLGSILAPQANAILTSGKITGSILSSSLSGSGSISYHPWLPFTPPCRPCQC